MKRLIMVLIIGSCLIGCACFDKLEDGNKLALENQTNLEKNVSRMLENYQKLAQSHPSYDAEKDQPIIDAQKKVIIEQMTINYAWLLVIQEAIKDDDLNAQLLGAVLKDLPDWIQTGKTIADLIKAKKGD